MLPSPKPENKAGAKKKVGGATHAPPVEETKNNAHQTRSKSVELAKKVANIESIKKAEQPKLRREKMPENMKDLDRTQYNHYLSAAHKLYND